MNEKITTKMYVEDRNFIERLKRKIKAKSNYETLHLIIKLFKKNKLHLDLIK